MFGENLLVELVSFLFFPSLVKIAGFFVEFLAVLVHRLFARIVILRESGTGESHEEREQYERNAVHLMVNG